ncbi:MAG: polysaccharide biosynthesis tyrosine autokinase [Chitinophagaceae bacterium]
MQSEPYYNPKTDENLAGSIWAKYFPFWPVFLLLNALAIGGAWFYLQFKVPVYETNATLLIKDERRGTEDSKIVESLDPLASKKVIENEIEIIKSKALMHQVVIALKLYAPVYEAGKWTNTSAYNSSPVKIELYSPDSLTEVKRVDFTYDVNTTLIKFNGYAYQSGKWINSPYGLLRFLPNNTAYHFNGPLYFSLVNPKRVVNELIENLSVTSLNKQSSVVNLKFKGEVPNRSEQIINVLVAAYEQASVYDKNKLGINTLAFLEERIKLVSTDLGLIEKQLQQYKARKGAINLSSQGTMFLQNVSDNDQKLSDVNVKLAMLKQVESDILSDDSRSGIGPATLDDPLLTGMIEKLTNFELQYEKLKRTTGENNPQLGSLLDQIQKLKPNILANINTQKKSLEASKININSTNNTYNSLLQGLPQQERELVEINREQNIKSSIYMFLLQKREETALSHSSDVADSRIVDKAQSTLEPVNESNLITYFIAVILALTLGVLFVSAHESFNRTILFRKEIEAMTSFPILGEIIYHKSKLPLLLQEGSSNYITGQFRMLRTSLSHLGITAKGKKILITSSISGDGKSFVTANLGLSLAMSGKKVVVVEFDLSNPALTSKLGMDNLAGVADFLLGDVEISDIIQKTQVNSNLYLISAGTLPSNPSDLISSDRVNDLLNNLSEKFDYIVLDSAPVATMPDAYVLSKKCDATLYVVRHKHTPKKILQRLEKTNEVNELKNIGLVFNGVSSRGFSGNNYGYGYGYEYKNKAKTKRKTEV